jgi:hypothetical protein
LDKKRTGLSFWTPKQPDLFTNDLNEAVTEELTSRFFERYGAETPMSYSYVNERKKLLSSIQQMVEKSEEPTSHDEVFEQFARAYFTGDMKPLAHKIHTTLGPGAFKQMLIS